jgi:protein SCO1/2
MKANKKQEMPEDQQELLKEVGIDEHLGVEIPTKELFFFDETGVRKSFDTYFHQQKAVLFLLLYFKCPHLCNYMVNGLMKSLKQLNYTVGKEFDLVMLSIDPKENFALAEQKKQNLLKEYGRPTDGWHVLTGEQEMIEKLSHIVGFKYRYDKVEDQYAHAAVIFLLTPEGVLSRYLYGVEFKPSDLKIGLLEASHGKIGTIADRILLYCFHYDPSLRSYSFAIFRLVQAGCVLTILSLGYFIGFYVLRKKKEQIV